MTSHKIVNRLLRRLISSKIVLLENDPPKLIVANDQKRTDFGYELIRLFLHNLEHSVNRHAGLRHLRHTTSTIVAPRVLNIIRRPLWDLR